MVFSLFLFKEEAKNCSFLTFYGGMPPPSLKRIMFAKQVTLLFCVVPTEFLVLYHYFPMLFYKWRRETDDSLQYLDFNCGLVCPKETTSDKKGGAHKYSCPSWPQLEETLPPSIPKIYGKPLSTSRKSILNGVLKFFEALKSSFYICLQWTRLKDYSWQLYATFK